eukprot:TRINITY_DN23558_c0_g1_i15.p1 TRINITY_DN23558_c0_g1~~TRINITY_DN23558_c0_g1_i15.p1  ORF type:complete len:211 (+),score=34.49 TRINITY_DN23558_c0_g1_i15:23-634(+)
MVYLRCYEGEGGREKIYTLGSSSRLLFGRQGEVEINDSLASRKHFVITRDNCKLKIQDLKSTHGTFVNDDKLEAGGSRGLQNGDIITVGSKVVTYQVCAEEIKDIGAYKQLAQRQSAAEGKASMLRQAPPPPPPRYRETGHKKRGRVDDAAQEVGREYKKRKDGRKHDQQLEGGLMSTRLDGPRPVQQMQISAINPNLHLSKI